ncbi:MAG: DUF488 domain-containing protein [Chloroflexi bacterium]|nr:DUF488 domain-containing protein [Chloroflexota bacterium]
MPLRAKRVYKDPAEDDGYRVLVDRLWPRGLRKEAARLDEWAKDLAPSDDLRRWFGHDPARWEEFVARYHAELDEHEGAVSALAERAGRGPVTLLYAAKDEAHNNAVALQRYIEGRFSAPTHEQ